MLGYIIYGEGPRRPVLGERQLSGGTFITLQMGLQARPNGPLALFRARQGARMLRESGVRSAVFPVDFPYTALFIRQGVLPVDTLPLRRLLAAPLTRRRLERLPAYPGGGGGLQRPGHPGGHRLRQGPGPQLPLRAAERPGGRGALRQEPAAGVRHLPAAGPVSGSAGPGGRPGPLLPQDGPGPEQPHPLHPLPRRRGREGAAAPVPAARPGGAGGVELRPGTAGGGDGCPCACQPGRLPRRKPTATRSSWRRRCTPWARCRRRHYWRKFLVDRMEKSLYNAMNDNGIRMAESCAFADFDAGTEDGKDRTP